MTCQHPDACQKRRRESKLCSQCCNKIKGVEHRQKISAALKKVWADPEVRKSASLFRKAQWAKPEYRARVLAAFYEKRGFVPGGIPVNTKTKTGIGARYLMNKLRTNGIPREERQRILAQEMVKP